MTKLSAIFDMVEVSEIGRRSVLKSETIGALGSGGTSASFHTRGTLTSEKEAFKMTAMGAARISAYSFRTQFGMLSGLVTDKYYIINKYILYSKGKLNFFLSNYLS